MTVPGSYVNIWILQSLSETKLPTILESAEERKTSTTSNGGIDNKAFSIADEKKPTKNGLRAGMAQPFNIY